jgi:hypothetical protein
LYLVDLKPVELKVDKYIWPNHLIGKVYVEVQSPLPRRLSFEGDMWIKRAAYGYLGKGKGSLIVFPLINNRFEIPFDTWNATAGAEWYWYLTYGGRIYIRLKFTLTGFILAKEIDVTNEVLVSR